MTSFVGGLPVAACLKPRLGLPTDVYARHRPRAPGRSVVQRERLQSELGHPAHPGRRSPLQTRRQAQRTGTSAELERSGGRISSTASSLAAAGRTGVRSQGWSKTAFVHLDPNPAESVRPTVGRRCERIPGYGCVLAPALCMDPVFAAACGARRRAIPGAGIVLDLSACADGAAHGRLSPVPLQLGATGREGARGYLTGDSRHSVLHRVRTVGLSSRCGRHGVRGHPGERGAAPSTGAARASASATAGSPPRSSCLPTIGMRRRGKSPGRTRARS